LQRLQNIKVKKELQDDLNKIKLKKHKVQVQLKKLELKLKQYKASEKLLQIQLKSEQEQKNRMSMQKQIKEIQDKITNEISLKEELLEIKKNFVLEEKRIKYLQNNKKKKL